MKGLNTLLSLALGLGFCGLLEGQRLAYTNVVLHLGNGQVIENGVLGMEGETIKVLGNAQEASKLEGYERIDGKGQHLYPGLIALNTQLGLVEVESVRATRDFAEVGTLNPHVRALIAYNTDSEIIPTVRSNGVLLSQAVPQGGRISGQSSAFYTAGHTWENAVAAQDVGLHLWWPSRFHASGWWGEPGPYRGNKSYDLEVQGVVEYMALAKAYAQKQQVAEKNLRFEAMKGLFNGSKTLFVHVDEAKGMLEALDFLKADVPKIVLVGAAEAWRIPEQLKARGAKLILSEPQSLPSHADADIDQPYKTPAQLHEMGVSFCLSMNGAWQQRNLPFQVGQAVAYGLPAEAAIQAITACPAEVLGLDKLGTLAVGKEATFIVSKGDVLDMVSSQITAAYIKGKPADLGDKHKRLFQRYMQVYGLK